MSNKTTTYEDLGVSSGKKEVHEAIKNLSKGLFPGAFCKILPDIAGNPDYCMVMHDDGTGTKAGQAYAHWKEMHDLQVMRNIGQDAIVMNLDDVVCVGAVGPFYISQTINRNKFNVTGDVLREIIEGTDAYLSRLRDNGVEIYSTGGETADVGDIVQTFIIDGCLVTRMKRSDVIDCSNIGPGNIIVGLASFGQSTYEEAYNSGIGSNGLTLARHGLFAKYLGEKYPELYDHKNLSMDEVFFGKWRLEDVLPGQPLNMGQLVLSPTRTYAPILIPFFNEVGRDSIAGIIHCSGGGQLKCMKMVDNVHIIKDTLFTPPAIFMELYNTGKVSEYEMYQTFNMGHRMEVYCKNEQTAQHLIEIAEKFNVSAQVIGRCEVMTDTAVSKKATIHSWTGTVLEYA